MPADGARRTAQIDPFEAVRREDARIETGLSRAFWLIAIVVLGIGGSAAFIHISGAVVASAMVVVESNSKAVQHLDGGIVQSIAVRDGQAVEKGDVLIVLAADRVGERMRGLASQVEAKRAQLTLLATELEDLKTLQAKRLVPRKQVVDAERQQAELQGQLGRLEADLARAQTDRNQLELRAPISGRVHELAVHTVGAVVAPAQELLKIVPSDAALVFEARVSPIDIDQVRVGQNASVRLSSFNQRTTPELSGRVINVSADLVRDEASGLFHYMVRIALEPGEDGIAALGDRELLPGMPAEIFIETDQRTILSFLVKPLTDHWERALREQ